MPEPIPPIPWELIGKTSLNLRDEGSTLGLIHGINFVGDRQVAGVVILEDGTQRGVVVVKGENDIPGTTPAYYSSEGSFTTPLHTGTSGVLTHTPIAFNNVTGTSGNTRIEVSDAGTFFIELHAEGATTGGLCDTGNDDTYFHWVIEFKHYNSSSVLQATLTETGGLLSFENCDLGGSLIAGAGILLNLAVGDYIETTIYLYEQLGFCASGCTTPSSAGDFTFSMHRVSKGS